MTRPIDAFTDRPPTRKAEDLERQLAEAKAEIELLRHGNGRRICSNCGQSVHKSQCHSPCNPELAVKIQMLESQLAAERGAKEKAERELKTIESLFFGGLMPEGWNLDGLAGQVRLALMKANNQRDEELTDAGNLKSAVSSLASKLTKTEQRAEAAEAENAKLREKLANSVQVVRGPAKITKGHWQTYHALPGTAWCVNGSTLQIGSDNIAIRLPEQEK